MLEGNAFAAFLFEAGGDDNDGFYRGPDAFRDDGRDGSGGRYDDDELDGLGDGGDRRVAREAEDFGALRIDGEDAAFVAVILEIMENGAADAAFAVGCTD